MSQIRESMKKTCTYCDAPNGQYETYLIRKAEKPKGHPHRWKNIGYCCEDCYKKGKSIEIEYT
jgi:hypothetical protein